MEENKLSRHLLKRCCAAVFYGVGGAVGSRILMMLATILLSRTLGQEVYGQYSSLYNTVNLFVTFSGIGVSATLTRYVAAARKDGSAAGMYIRTLGSICAVMSLILSAVLFIFSRQISLLSTGVDTLSPYFRIVAVAVFFSSMAAVEQSILVGYEMFRQSSLIQVVRCAFYCGAGYLLSLVWGIYGAVISLALSHVIQFFLYHVENRKYYRTHAVVLSWQWNHDTREATYSYAIPAFISGLFVMPVHWIANAMLTRTAGFAELAVFSVANQWMTYITYIPAQMGQMRPIYTDLYVTHKMKDLKKLVLKITAVTTLIAAVIAAAASAASGMILSMYGEGYVSGRLTYILMVTAAVLYTAQVQTGFILQAMKKMWISAGINAAWGVVLLVTYACLIEWGSMGYAVAYCVAYTSILMLQLTLSLKYLSEAPTDDQGIEKKKAVR